MRTKTQLSEWLVNENNDCGNDTYFSADKRGAISVQQSFNKFMKMTKSELESIVFNFSAEGEQFLKS